MRGQGPKPDFGCRRRAACKFETLLEPFRRTIRDALRQAPDSRLDRGEHDGRGSYLPLEANRHEVGSNAAHSPSGPDPRLAGWPSPPSTTRAQTAVTPPDGGSASVRAATRSER